MKYVNWGDNLKVSKIGLGFMGMSHAYGEPLSEKSGMELITEAVDIGCTFLTLQKFMVLPIIRTTTRSF